jgi:hypothetical protein
MAIHPDNLLPPDSEIAQKLMQWSEDMDTRTWHIADVTNDLIEELEGQAITKADIYKAVGARCRGQKPNTIRRLAEVARDYDRDTREQFQEILSFSHFKTARRLFQEGHTPYLSYALEWCVDGNDYKLSAGRFHTVGDMLNQFLPQYRDAHPLQSYWARVKEKLYDLMLLEDNDTKRNHMLENWRELEGTISTLVPLDKSEK